MNHASIKTIKNKVKDRRRSLKISQEAMAAQLHMSKENYAKYERQGLENSLYLDVFLQISDILGVPPTYLMPASKATLEAVNEAQEGIDDLKTINAINDKNIKKMQARLDNYKS